MTVGLSKNGSDGSDGFAEIETRDGRVNMVPVQPAGFGRKVGRHFRRFWWLHLIIFCVSFLIIALCLVYVAMPRIAQSGVDETSLSFFELQFLNPSPTNVTLTQLANLHSPSIYTPTLDPFTAGLWLVTNGSFGPSPFSNILFPSIHALHPNSNVSIVSQVLPILDESQLAQYATEVLSQQNVTTALTGSTKLHEGKLPVVTIQYNSSTTYAALNGLQGFNTTDLRINITAPAGQPNLVGNAYIPNPSVMTVEMGNVTLELSTKNGVVGMATINDLTIRPGPNNFPMTANIDELAVLSAKDNTTGLVQMFITGNSSTYNGLRIPYYEQALSSNKLSLELNVMQVLADSGY